MFDIVDHMITGDRDPLSVKRGSGPVDQATAAARARQSPDPVVPILGAPVPARMTERGVVIQGAQGSGKTLTILKLLVPELLALRDPGRRTKVVVVDAKGDLTSSVLAMRRALCPEAPLYLVNPFERFGYSPDPAEFAREPTSITRLVHALTFRRRDARSDDFFDTYARAHLVDLVKILQRTYLCRWGWRDLYHIATSYERLERVLKNSPIGAAKAGTIVKKMFAGVVATLQSWLDPYEAAFACWDRSPTFRLEDVLRSRGIVILTVPEDQIESLSPIARLILRVVKDRLLTDTGRDPGAKTTLVLDEFADLQQCVEVIAPLFGRARAARVSVVCAWQSFPAVCDAHGETRVKGIIDNVALRLWLGCGAESAEVASKNCMSAEVKRRDVSYTEGQHSSRTEAYRTEIRTNVLPGEIQGLEPPTAIDLRVRGYLTANHLPGPLYCEERYEPFVDFLNRLPYIPPVRPRPPEDLWLRDWDDVSDGARLDAVLCGR
jgi:type IV secretory pathway TraG/TraD family ATPase VirD4